MFDATTLKTLFDAKTIPSLKPDRQLSQVRFTPCGKYLLAAGHDGLIHRWDLSTETPTELPALAGHNGWVQAVVCRSAGEAVLSVDSWGQLRCGPYGGEQTAATWSVPQAHDGWITDLALSPDGAQVATAGYDRVVRLWNAATGEKLREFTGHASEVFSVAFAPDGGSIYSGDLDGRVKQWRLSDGGLVRELDATVLHLVNRLQDVGGARRLAASRLAPRLLVAGTKPANGGNVQGIPTVLVFDLEQGELLKTVALGQNGDVYVTDLLELSDGQWLATISGNPGAGKVVAFSLDAEKPAFETTKLPNVHSISLHPNGLRLAISGTNANSNGNGRPMDKDGKYPGNFSPIHLFTLPG